MFDFFWCVCILLGIKCERSVEDFTRKEKNEKKCKYYNDNNFNYVYACWM